MLRSIALKSDLLAMQGLSDVEQHDDTIILRTPSEPTYWCGNAIIKTNTSISADADISFFHEHFPNATHVKIIWDTPCPEADQLRAHFPERFEIDSYEAMTLVGPTKSSACPAGIKLRMLSSESDWAASAGLASEVAQEEGFDPEKNIPFLKRRFENRRTQIANGFGAWFGAFEGNTLVAHMGMFHDQEIARFQSVETRKTHRRRGVCSALLSHVIDWTAQRAPNATQVIVAESNSDAGRLYQRHGFQTTEHLIEATFRGY